MVEILEKGKLKKYKIKCFHCNSILQFTSLDEETDTNLNSPEVTSTDWSIECPNCHNYVPTRSLTDENYYDWRIKVDENK